MESDIPPTSTDSPGAKSSRAQLKWTTDMEVVFIATMKSMQSHPTKNIPSGFTKEAYKRAAEIMKENSMQPDLCDDVRMKNKVGSMRNDWRTYLNLLNLGWPRLPNGVPTNTDAVMETYYKEQDQNARKFKTAPLRHLIELTELFDPSQKEWVEVAANQQGQGADNLLAGLSSASSTSQPATRPSAPLSLPHSPYQPAEKQVPAVYKSPYSAEAGSPDLPGKRAAETSLFNQAKRILADPANGLALQRQALHESTDSRLDTSKLSPVAAATALFTRTFQFLPVKARVAVVQRFLDQNAAEIFLHTDAEVRKALVVDWTREAGAGD